MNLFKPYIFLLLGSVFFAIWVAFAQAEEAEGEERGKGGDSCIALFKDLGASFQNEIKINAVFRNFLTETLKPFGSNKLNELQEALKNADVETTDKDIKVSVQKTVKGQLIKESKKVEAKNDAELNLITLSRSLWCLRALDSYKVTLVFHEYLGLIGVEETNDFTISKQLFNLAKIRISDFTKVCHLDDEQFLNNKVQKLVGEIIEKLINFVKKNEAQKVATGVYKPKEIRPYALGILDLSYKIALAAQVSNNGTWDEFGRYGDCVGVRYGNDLCKKKIEPLLNRFYKIEDERKMLIEKVADRIKEFAHVLILVGEVDSSIHEALEIVEEDGEKHKRDFYSEINRIQKSYTEVKSEISKASAMCQ